MTYKVKDAMKAEDIKAIYRQWRDSILKVVSDKPSWTFADVGVMFGVSSSYVGAIARQAGIRRGRGWQKGDAK
jgi:hypothetical protein